MGKPKKEFIQTLPTTKVYSFKEDGSIDIKSAMHDAHNLEWHTLGWLDGERVLKAIVVGNEYYAVIEHTVSVQNKVRLKQPIVEKYIIAGKYSLRMDKKAIEKGHNFASRIWKETEYPPIHNCPPSIIKAAGETSSVTATAWRNNCLQKRSEEKVDSINMFDLDNLPIGSIIEFSVDNKKGAKIYKCELVPPHQINYPKYDFKKPVWLLLDTREFLAPKDVKLIERFKILRYGYGE